jgi:adenosylcobyric acid synthase
MERFEHGGNIHRVQRSGRGEFIDFSANINPLGPPDWLRPLVSRHLENLQHYPDPDCTGFVQAIAASTALSPAEIVVANGSTELLYTIMRVIPWQRIVLPVPSYVDYLRAAELGGRAVLLLPLAEEEDFQLNLEVLEEHLLPGDLVVIATPNNPTGRGVDRQALAALTERRPEVSFLLDEAFLDFVEKTSSLAGHGENLLTLRSMTKFYGLPGLRLGYGTFPKSLATTIRRQLPPWTVNSLAQAVGERAVADHEYQQKSRTAIGRLRQDFAEQLSRISAVKVFPGEANYLFLKILTSTDSARLAEFCLQRGVMIRRCDNYPGLSSGRFFRLAVRREEENARLLSVLHAFWPTSVKKAARPPRAAALMVQGTCSDAGKSIIATGFCRIFRQDGLLVAPFKAQNMSLNSFVTRAGHEMGRAQVVQAQAAGVDPDSRMNPLLLKPNSDTGSQIIVSGKPVGNMTVSGYNAYKPIAWETVKSCYDSLAGEYQVVVLEGAGSPGEVNLKADDLVNMRMARYADAAVLIVGDIDRGGVYASFVGTMEVLAEWERRLVRGFLVNKFRGEADLLAAAHSYVREHTGRPVLGVIPYLADLGLPQEDSVTFKKGSFNRRRSGDAVEIAVIDLPHIANFTDIEPLLEEPDVNVHIVKQGSEVKSPAAIILPGSKNVIADLTHLERHGLVAAIRQAVAAGAELVGICGGYQMLGKKIGDPYAIESATREMDGMGFLAMTTQIEAEKRLTRKSGHHSLSGERVFGYEIHHGISTQNGEPVLLFDDGSSCGLISPDNMVWGSYLHGIFDSDTFRRWFIDRLRQRNGLAPLGQVIATYNLENSFDRLADCLRENVDMTKIYQFLKL